MERMRYALAVVVLCFAACKKDVKEYKITLDASCYDCIVQYAAGADRGIRDTLTGGVNAATGDTFTSSGQYDLVLLENEAIYFRACRMRPDSAAFGDIILLVTGQVVPISETAGMAEECAIINQATQTRE